MSKKLVIFNKPEEFDRFRKSKHYNHPWLRIRVVSSNQNTPRFGFIIPKKVLPKVTDRNKLRRRIKAHLAQVLNKIAPSDVLIFPGKQALKATYQELGNAINQLLIQARLWKQ